MMNLLSAVGMLLLGALMLNECLYRQSPEERQADLATHTALAATEVTAHLEGTIATQRSEIEQLLSAGKTPTPGPPGCPSTAQEAA
jgi:hypothetical protein